MYRCGRRLAHSDAQGVRLDHYTLAAATLVQVAQTIKSRLFDTAPEVPSLTHIRVLNPPEEEIAAKKQFHRKRLLAS